MFALILALALFPVDAGAQAHAQHHAEAMAAAGRLWHSDLSRVPGQWEKVGENVGTGSDLSIIVEAMWRSPAHAANLVGDWTGWGIGQKRDQSGALWVAIVFVKRYAKLTPPQPKVVPQPSPKPPARVWEPPEACGDNLVRICYL